MGVHGLSPFLQKHCAEVFKYLPNRLRDLSGRKIILDGTLITQRFHFSPDPNPYRHVLGWYRIAKELMESDVSAVCIFDGKERNSAKSREAERRRSIRRLAEARGKLELDRLSRLEHLGKLLVQLQVLDDDSKHQVSEVLDRLGIEGKDGTDEDFLNARNLLGSQASPTALRTLDNPALEYNHAQPDFADTNLLPDDTQGKLELAQPLTHASLNWLGKFPVSIPTKLQDQSFPTTRHASFMHVTPSSLPLYDASSIMAALYSNYKQSIAQLAFLTLEAQLSRSVSDSVASDSEAEDETGAEKIMTKAQCQLAIMEGGLWRDLASFGSLLLCDKSSLENVAGFSQLNTLAAILVSKSHFMAESFRRRSKLPQFGIYDESRDILRAMGIPCIESEGPFDAEAVACSMVHHGVADYVVSEDTDVLVYGATMIRNLTNRHDPLILVSGSEVRKKLGLNRESYIDFALLLGTDFSQRIKGIGPNRALKFIKAYGSIEHIIESEPKYPPRMPCSEYLAEVNVARSVFEILPPVPDRELLKKVEKDDIAVSQVLQRYGLGRVLMESNDWDYQGALEGNYFEDDPSAL